MKFEQPTQPQTLPMPSDFDPEPSEGPPDGSRWMFVLSVMAGLGALLLVVRHL